jgi:hypothetical protein
MALNSTASALYIIVAIGTAQCNKSTTKNIFSKRCFTVFCISVRPSVETTVDSKAKDRSEKIIAGTLLYCIERPTQNTYRSGDLIYKLKSFMKILPWAGWGGLGERGMV